LHNDLILNGLRYGLSIFLKKDKQKIDKLS